MFGLPVQVDDQKHYDIANYEGLTYITKSNGPCDMFYRSPMLITNSYVANGGTNVKWFSDDKLMIKLASHRYAIGDKIYNLIVPCVLEPRRKRRHYEAFSAGSLVDGVVYSNDAFQEIKDTRGLKIIRTPWYIVRNYTIDLHHFAIFPRQLVWVFVGSSCSMGCISTDEYAPIKLNNSTIQSLYYLEQKELNSVSSNGELVDLTCLRLRAPKTAELVLDYLVDKYILFNMADVACLKQFMNERHFNIWNKSTCFAEPSDMKNYIIVSSIQSWITGNCDDAILNLLPILIKRGYIGECAAAICQTNDTKLVNVKLGKFIKFDKARVRDGCTLFGQYTTINPIEYHIREGNIDRAVDFITYHDLHSVRCFDRLIESKCQPLIKWMFESGKYNSYIREYKRGVINYITDAENTKIYLKKLGATISSIGNHGLNELLKHLIKCVSRFQLVEILLGLPDCKVGDVNSIIQKSLECTLFEIVVSVRWNNYLKNTEGRQAAMNNFDKIYNDYKGDTRLLYRIENDHPNGVAVSLSYHIDIYEEALTMIVKKYNLRDIMNIMDYTDPHRTNRVAWRIQNWIDKFIW